VFSTLFYEVFEELIIIDKEKASDNLEVSSSFELLLDRLISFYSRITPS